MIFLERLETLEWRLNEVDPNVTNNLANKKKIIALLNKLSCDGIQLKAKLISCKWLQKLWLTSTILKIIATKSKSLKWSRLTIISERVNGSIRNKVTSVVRTAKGTITLPSI